MADSERYENTAERPSESDGGQDPMFAPDAHQGESFWASTTSHAGHNQEASYQPSTPSDGQPLLHVLRVVQQYNIQMFRLDRRHYSANRSVLGEGATSRVDQLAAPSATNMACPPYRNPSKLTCGSNPFANVFTDDQNMSWDPWSFMAFKYFNPTTEKNLQLRVAGLITDLTVLYTPGVRGHPNIIIPVGIAWTRHEDLVVDDDPTVGEQARKPSIWPIVITARSAHLSLTELMKSNKFNPPGDPISLYVKLRLCIDVLRGLKALHMRDIVHRDIKCDNAVVSSTDEGTTRNWRVRLCDFNLSIVGVSTKDSYSPSDVRGTRLFYPPEALGQESIQSGDIFKSDIWCWGMLMWQLMLDGGIEGREGLSIFTDQSGNPIPIETLQVLKSRGELGAVASSSCTRHLAGSSPGVNRDLIELVQKMIQDSLQVNARDRPSASDLLEFAVQQLGRIAPSHVEMEVPGFSGNGLKAKKSYPQFDVTKLYYEVLSFSRLQKIAVAELSEMQKPALRLPLEEVQESEFQLELCRIAGVGLETDYVNAFNNLVTLAEKGHTKAQLSIWSVATCLGQSMSPELSEKIVDWVTKAAEQANIFALTTLAGLNYDKFRRVLTNLQQVMDTTQHALIWAQIGEVGTLLESISNSESDNIRGDYGETPLHRVALCRAPKCAVVVRSLLDNGAENSCRTLLPVGIHGSESKLEFIPGHTTALEWAVIVDNPVVVKAFLDYTPDGSLITPDLLIRACQSLSIHSLEMLIEKLQTDGSWTSVRETTKNGCRLMYWALRPNFFYHLLSSHPKYGMERQASLVELQLNVIWALKDAGCSWDIQEEHLISPVHMLAAYGQADLLDGFLRRLTNEDKLLLSNTRTSYTWSPIRDAMIRGNPEIFHILLTHGASLKNCFALRTSNVSLETHAAHYCGLCEEEPSVLFAQRITEVEPKAYLHRDQSKNTPLHYAAQAGNVPLIKFWLAIGADIMSYGYNQYTPLGQAVWARAVPSVRILQAEYLKRRLPLVGAKPVAIINTFHARASATALSMLLLPGSYSPPETQSMFQNRMRMLHYIEPLGCNDIAWCTASQLIFAELLDQFQDIVRWNINLGDRMMMLSERHSGIEYAVRFGNSAAVTGLLESGKFKFCYRSLLQNACDQLHIGLEHPSSITTRKEILRELMKREQEFFRKRQESRHASSLRIIWRIFYQIYGTPEQELYERSVQWQIENRNMGFRPLFVEFLPWPRVPYFYVIIHNIIVIALVASTIICGVLLLRGQDSSRNSDKLPFLVAASVMTLILSQWIAISRFICIVLNLLLERRAYPSLLDWSTPLRPMFRVSVSILFGAMAVANAHFLNLLNGYRWNLETPQSDLKHLTKALDVLCGILIAWSIVFCLCATIVYTLSTMREVGLRRGPLANVAVNHQLRQWNRDTTKIVVAYRGDLLYPDGCPWIY